LFLYYITDRKQLSSDEAEARRLLLARIAQAAEAGIDAIQLREKDLGTKQILALSVEVLERLRELSLSTKFLINSRMDVALACGADGVHLPSNDISPSEARALLAEAGRFQPVISRSCHSIREVELTEGHGADFAVFAPAFEKLGTATADGLQLLREACMQRRAASPKMPVLALGGVTLQNAEQCLAAGADGIAGIRLFQSGNLRETVTRLRAMKQP
jgi:thiamine-phosphate pyrophosphorylase